MEVASSFKEEETEKDNTTTVDNGDSETSKNNSSDDNNNDNTTTVVKGSENSESNSDSNNDSNNSNSSSQDAVVKTMDSEQERLETQKAIRYRVVNEILNTEKSYVNSLSLVIKYFLQPMRARSIVTPDLIQTIFFNIETIYQINVQFLNLLTQAILGPPTPVAGDECIGDLFLSAVIDFQDYIDYCKAHQNSILAVAKLERQSSFSTFVENVKCRPEIGKLDLLSFLIMPVQRIPRYQLLLTETLNQTPPTHPDFNSLQLALARVCNAGISINESIRHNEALQKVVLIQKRFIGPIKIVTPNRTFVREGALKKVCRKVPKARWFILFNDVLVYASTITNSSNNNANEYQYAAASSNSAPILSFHRMIKVSNISRIKDLKGPKFHNYSFQIISNEKSFTVFAESESEKESWIRDLQSLVKGNDFANIDDDQSNHNLELEEAPVWVPDNHVKRCMICGNNFSIIFRRHHCRNCGKVVCGSCSNKRRVLPFCPEEGMVRVCNFCFDYLELTKKDIRTSDEIKGNASPPLLPETPTKELNASVIDVSKENGPRNSLENSGGNSLAKSLADSDLSPQNSNRTSQTDIPITFSPQLETRPRSNDHLNKPSSTENSVHTTDTTISQNNPTKDNEGNLEIANTTTEEKTETEEKTQSEEKTKSEENNDNSNDNSNSPTTNSPQQTPLFSKSVILEKTPKLMIGRRNPSVEKSLVDIFT
eukprot:TRINITY_DN3397_c0_g1_i1.p1 TRINITY_DN3397_c0_g1~~TRINITY_DN3397_c0_g1_i1.p1  ORF type:complete len:711 (-),score=147.22 TRINITY_DN3397_c0_g1_i1:104-2236(-)